MLQCESAMAAAGSALRLRLLYRMLRAGELLALVAFVSWSSSYVPSAVAAALRLAGSLLLNARFVFVLGNAIVLLLFALSRHDLSPSTSSSSNDGEQQQQQQPASSSCTPAAQQASPSSPVPPPVAAAGDFPSFTTTPTTLPSMGFVDAASSFASMDEAVLGAAPAAELSFELDNNNTKLVAARGGVLNNNTKARAPRRSRSEKMSSRRAASPELRRCESENGGRRRRSSVTARDAEACWGREDADEFRRTVEAFIARQTRFHREESIKTTMAHCQPELSPLSNKKFQK